MISCYDLEIILIKISYFCLLYIKKEQTVESESNHPVYYLLKFDNMAPKFPCTYLPTHES